MSALQSVFYLLLALSLLVLVHEWGHFFVARRAGVRVLRFSIGFGPELIGVTRGDTRYSICAILFGGYVKFAGDNPEEERDEASDEFLSQSVGVRSAIVLAGPVMNYVLAILLFAGVLYVSGVPDVSTRRIGAVAEDTPAAALGVQVDDLIVSVNGIAVDDWNAFDEEISRIGAVEDFTLEVKRAGANVTLSGRAPEDGGFAERWIGVSPFNDPIVASVKKGSPAWEAGLRDGDRIVSLDGREVDRWSVMAEIIRENPEREIALAWVREGQTLDGTVTPDAVSMPMGPDEMQTVGQIGVQRVLETRRIGLLPAIAGGWERTWWLTEMVGRTLPRLPVIIFRALFQGEKDTGLGGPVRMAELFGEAARWGALAFITMMANISTQLAIFNLLPIPVLDGGHLFLYLVEVVTRRPPSLRIKIILQQIGLALLVLLMLSVTVMDVGRFFG